MDIAIAGLSQNDLALIDLLRSRENEDQPGLTTEQLERLTGLGDDAIRRRLRRLMRQLEDDPTATHRLVPVRIRITAINGQQNHSTAYRLEEK